MKKILCLIVVLLILVSVASCAPKLYTYEELFDIKEGMSKKEVVSRFGEYHRIEFVPIGYNNGDYSFFVYDSSDGNSIAVHYTSEAKVSHVIELPKEKTDLPTYRELLQIDHGMPREDVLEQYGYPQRYMRNPPTATDTYDGMYCIYDSSDGRSVAVLFVEDENSKWSVGDVVTVST